MNGGFLKLKYKHSFFTVVGVDIINRGPSVSRNRLLSKGGGRIQNKIIPS